MNMNLSIEISSEGIRITNNMQYTAVISYKKRYHQYGCRLLPRHVIYPGTWIEVKELPDFKDMAVTWEE